MCSNQMLPSKDLMDDSLGCVLKPNVTTSTKFVYVPSESQYLVKMHDGDALSNMQGQIFPPSNPNPYDLAHPISVEFHVIMGWCHD